MSIETMMVVNAMYDSPEGTDKLRTDVDSLMDAVGASGVDIDVSHALSIP